jgi:hypothetical protein
MMDENAKLIGNALTVLSARVINVKKILGPRIAPLIGIVLAVKYAKADIVIESRK